ncbi:MAG: hypothetical protein AABZ13_11200 [Planctomycetota bacterium]
MANLAKTQEIASVFILSAQLSSGEKGTTLPVYCVFPLNFVELQCREAGPLPEIAA